MRFASCNIVAVAALGVVLAACKKDEKAPADESAEAVAKPSEAGDAPSDPSEPTPAEPASAAEEGAVDPADSGHPTGVKECDDLIAKYTACVRAKAPETSRDETLQGFQANVDAWVKAAADEAKRSELAAGCQQTAEELRKSSEGWGCEW